MRLSVCCFFFKQKTAYDMRISDWSSDVCSSDLAALVHQHQVPLVHPRMVGDELPPEADTIGVQPGAVAGTACKIDHRIFAPSQIGSASCRARVCQYV